MSEEISLRSPSNSTDSTTVSEELDHSMLYRSLEAALQHPNCVNAEWIDTIEDFSGNLNPRILPTPPYNDGSLHWVSKDNDVLCMAFPAVVDVDGKYSKIGSYFNLMTDVAKKVTVSHFYSQSSSNLFLPQTPTIPAIGKVRAVFQLSPLTVLSAPDIPPDAITCSSRALHVLQTLYGTEQAKRNKRLSLLLALIIFNLYVTKIY
jgi:hypothetical protein